MVSSTKQTWRPTRLWGLAARYATQGAASVYICVADRSGFCDDASSSVFFPHAHSSFLILYLGYMAMTMAWLLLLLLLHGIDIHPSTRYACTHLQYASTYYGSIDVWNWLLLGRPRGFYTSIRLTITRTNHLFGKKPNKRRTFLFSHAEVGSTTSTASKQTAVMHVSRQPGLGSRPAGP